MTEPAGPPEQSGRPDDSAARDKSTAAAGRRKRAPALGEGTLPEQMGGVSGLVYSSLPVVVFVAVNAIAGLQPGIWSALGSAVLITLVRLVRKEPLQPAISGFFGVAVAAFIAYRTGSAKGFFAYGIWMSLVFGVVMLGSVAVRWPLVGVVWSYLNGADMRWRADRRCRAGYDVATLAMAAVFAARFVVQGWLYNDDQTGWLAVAKIGMGYPLWGLALLVAVWAVRRSDRRLRELDAAAEAAGQRPETDAEAEARLRAKYSG